MAQTGRQSLPKNTVEVIPLAHACLCKFIVQMNSFLDEHVVWEGCEGHLPCQTQPGWEYHSPWWTWKLAFTAEDWTLCSLFPLPLPLFLCASLDHRLLSWVFILLLPQENLLVWLRTACRSYFCCMICIFPQGQLLNECFLVNRILNYSQ